MAHQKQLTTLTDVDERSARYVFVANIHSEVTETILADMFAQVGPMVGFRLMCDPLTGKPVGYGCCEYQNVDTAQNAVRIFNGRDMYGRQLKVGIATAEQAREASRVVNLVVAVPSSSGRPPNEGGAYGEPSESDKAPEAISRAVASLPPQQMFELMKQMKLCIQNNPNEARNMLLQNPQLAYALLQAQIVMKIVDPQVALAMLNRQVDQIPPAQPSVQSAGGSAMEASTNQMLQGSSTSTAPMTRGPVETRPSVGGRPDAAGQELATTGPRIRSGLLGVKPQGAEQSWGQQTVRPDPVVQPQRDPREMLGGPPRDPREPIRMGGTDSRLEPVGHGADFRQDPRLVLGTASKGAGGDVRDPRVGRSGLVTATSAVRQGTAAAPTASNSVAVPSAGTAPAPTLSQQDQEKAQLIYQVLQLSDEQIALLPQDQRNSIMILKQQISKSAAQPS